MIVHGHDGMDEITVTTTTRITELRGDRLRTYEFDPLPFIGEYYKLSELTGGMPEENARILKNILGGAQGAPREIVVLNAAAAIIAGGLAEEWKDAVTLAKQALSSGKALAVLQGIITITNNN